VERWTESTFSSFPSEGNLFANSLARNFAAKSAFNPDVINGIVKFVEGILENPLIQCVRFTSCCEIEWRIRHLQLCTAAGPVGIQNLVLQHLPGTFPKFMANMQY